MKTLLTNQALGIATVRSVTSTMLLLLVENFSPGVIDRLGLGYDTLRELNPRLIYAQVKGFAADSPYRDYPCFDPIAQALSGGSSITGEPDGLPMKPAT